MQDIDYQAMTNEELAERGLKLKAELSRIYDDYKYTNLALEMRLMEEGISSEEEWCDKRMETSLGDVIPEFSKGRLVITDYDALANWCVKNKYHDGIEGDRLLEAQMCWVILHQVALLAEMEPHPGGWVEYHGIKVDGVEYLQPSPSGISFHPCAALKKATAEGRQI